MIAPASCRCFDDRQRAIEVIGQLTNGAGKMPVLLPEREISIPYFYIHSDYLRYHSPGLATDLIVLEFRDGAGEVSSPSAVSFARG
jgi:hypothetical protein